MEVLMIMKLLPAASEIRAKVIFLFRKQTHSFSIEKTQKVFMKDVIAGVLSKKIQKEVVHENNFLIHISRIPFCRNTGSH